MWKPSIGKRTRDSRPRQSRSSSPEQPPRKMQGKPAPLVLSRRDQTRPISDSLPSGSRPYTPAALNSRRPSDGYSYEVVSSDSELSNVFSPGLSPVLSPTTTRDKMLEALNQPATGDEAYRPLAAVVTRYRDWLNKRPPWACISTDIAGSNQDCVLAAFRSASSRKVDESSINRLNTSSDDGIRFVARLYGMGRISSEQLMSLLPRIEPQQISKYTQGTNPKARRAFIQAPALDGVRGRYHAYAAVGIDTKTKKVIAWDPDENHRDFKLVPPSLIELIFIEPELGS